MQIFDVFTFLSDRGIFGLYGPEDDFKVLRYVDKNGKTWTEEELQQRAEKMIGVLKA